MHFVLDGLEKQASCLCVFVIVKRSSVQVCHFLIEFSLRQANLPNLLQLPLKVFVGEHMAFFQPLHIHRPTLNSMVFDDLSRPFAELHSPLVIHLEAYGNNEL